MKIPSILLAVFLTASAFAQTQVKTAAGLPRFSFPVMGSVQDLLDMPQERFQAFARPVGAAIEKTLQNYRIGDHAFERTLLRLRPSADSCARGQSLGAKWLQANHVRVVNRCADTKKGGCEFGRTSPPDRSEALGRIAGGIHGNALTGMEQA